LDSVTISGCQVQVIDQPVGIFDQPALGGFHSVHRPVSAYVFAARSSSARSIFFIFIIASIAFGC